MLKRDYAPNGFAGKYKPILRYTKTEIPLISQLREMLEGKFIIKMRIWDINQNLYVNGKPCIVRKWKRKPITIYPGTKLLKGTPMPYGGSNQYPRMTFKEDEIIVEVETDGFPHLDLDSYQMKVEILSLEKIN